MTPFGWRTRIFRGRTCVSRLLRLICPLTDVTATVDRDGGFVTKRIISTVCLALAAALFCLHAAALDADAARFGGGKSFGGKSSYSRTAPTPRTTPQQQGYTNQQKQGQNPAAAAARPGMGSGFRGMLGGLLAGTLLGSLLFGGGFGGAGMMDIVILALVAFLALKLIRMVMNRRTAEAVPGGGNVREAQDFAPRPEPWQGMQGGAGDASAHSAGGSDIRLAGFDQDDFLRGAKMLYTRLQNSWDKRDVADIATFTTDVILSEVKAQAEADPSPSKTEIMLVNASLVSAERDGEEDVATVFFDVLLRESPDAQVPSQTRELWHFTRPAGSSESWRLDGIQQVE